MAIFNKKRVVRTTVLRHVIHFKLGKFRLKVWDRTRTVVSSKDVLTPCSISAGAVNAVG